MFLGHLIHLVYGFVDLVESMGPLNKCAWRVLRHKHCVPGNTLPYGARTCGWVVANPQRLKTPIKIVRSRGSVLWQLGLDL